MSAVVVRSTALSRIESRLSELGFSPEEKWEKLETPHKMLGHMVDIGTTLSQLRKFFSKVDQPSSLDENKDVKDSEILANVEANLQLLNTYLEKMMSQRSAIASFVMAPFSGDFIEIEHSQHKLLCLLMTQISSFMTSMTHQDTLLEWASHQATFPDCHVDVKLNSILTCFTIAKRYYDALVSLEARTMELYEIN